MHRGLILTHKCWNEEFLGFVHTGLMLLLYSLLVQ